MTKLCKGTSGFDVDYSTYEEFQKWREGIRRKIIEQTLQEQSEKEQFERDYPLRLTVRVWDRLTEPKISLAALFTGNFTAAVVVVLLNWWLK